MSIREDEQKKKLMELLSISCYTIALKNIFFKSQKKKKRKKVYF